MVNSHLMRLALHNPQGNQCEECTYLACVIADLAIHSPANTEKPYNHANQGSTGRPHPVAGEGEHTK